MAQLYRDQFSHFINTTPNAESKKYVLEGVGVESLSIAFNPQIDTYKTIIQRNAQSTFNSYQMQSSISGKRLYSDDEIYTFLDEARRGAKAIETQMLEVDMASTVSVGKYKAIEYNVLIVINEFLGENATISYDVYFQTVTEGTATVVGGTPTFEADTQTL